jgi:cell division septum initiation protein DivIVA
MDQNKFINTYIDIVVNSLLEYVKTNMQLQTQIKVNEFVVAEKDQIIASLNQKFLENKVAEDWKVKYEAAETNYAASQNKLKHMDTLLAQISDMKKKEEVTSLTEQITQEKTLDDF